MQASAVQEHWRDWATQYGTDLRATTLSSSIKRLEIAALKRAIGKCHLVTKPSRVLEVGCGNGQNIIGLSPHFKDVLWEGIDYAPEMIDAARENAKLHGISASFRVGDVLRLVSEPNHDVVFTDRLLINLPSIEEQLFALKILRQCVRPNGTLILIENSRQTKDAQNDLREAMGLSRRKDAEFNLFLDDEIIIPYLKSLFLRVDVGDFGSLHDILLYVLLPAIVGAEFQYEHPLMGRVADLCEKVNIPAGAFGQNRMYVCR